ncbi:MAG: phenylacetate--CoA ligase [Spirochaetales bacterium]|nr:phenylacetate--CoA ligase [Spirochaetales bacterium]
MIFNKDAESMNIEQRKAQQLKDWQKTIRAVYANVPFYKKKFDDAGFKPEDLQSLEDVSKIPFTTKYELRETYPYGLLAVDKKELVEIHMSSGTTGTPVVGAYTQHDINFWGESMARTFAGGGASSSDTIQNAYGYGLFTGGLGAHYGARTLGANAIPISAGNTAKQLQVMRDFQTDVICCTPSYSLYLAESAREEGLDIKDLPLRIGFFGAEPWSEEMRQQIEAELKIKAYDIYGLTEIIGPGVAFECEEQEGLHINEDFFYPEIINPETGEVLPEGEKGELVFTTITREGAPIIRYRTRDITYLYRDKCKCGRTTVKMHRLFGRSDDMLIIRGVNVFPSQIEEILIQNEGTQPHYQIIVDRGESHLDSIEVMVEVEESVFSDETKDLEKLRTKISTEIKSKLGVNAKIRLVEPKSIQRSEGKAKRVIDKRKM